MLYISPGTICVFSNGIWKPIQKTPFEDVLDNKGFRSFIPHMKRGELRKHNGHSFKIQQAPARD